MIRPTLTVVAPDRGSADRSTRDGHERAAEAAELALDMMGRAFEALALLYELRHPGEYAAQAGKLKEYVADNLRHVEQASGDRLASGAFRDAVLRVRDLFEKVDQEVAAMLPIDTVRAA